MNTQRNTLATPPQFCLNKILLSMGLAACLGTGFTSVAYAQNAEDQNTAETQDTQEQEKKESTLEVITVTSEKRVQNLQEVPVAISAFTANMLEARGIDTPQDLQNAVPGLSIAAQNNTGGTARATIRGVGNENYQPGGDPGVPIHINGHYTQSTAYIFRDMIDVERVEVQRGPQGTLYGRNAVGGNINIITNRPSDYFEGYVGLELGNYNKHNVQAVINAPLSEQIKARIAVVDEKRDGYVKDIGVVGNDRDTSDYTAIRGAIDFDVSDDINIYINAYSFDDKGNAYARRLDTNPDNIATDNPWKVRTDIPSEQIDESVGASFDLTWDLGNLQFKSLSAYDDTSKKVINDDDSSDSDEVYAVFSALLEYKTFTQELQLLSTDNDDLQWVAGLFYYKEDSNLTIDIGSDGLYDTNGDGVIDIDTDPFGLYNQVSDLNAKSYAAYGQLDYSLTPKLELVVGARYTKDKKNRLQILNFDYSDGSDYCLFGVLCGGSSEIRQDNREGDSWDEVTGKVGLNYQASSDLMYYVSASRGYKAGGYNNDQLEAYDPEYVNAFEAGIKSRWNDDAVQLNLATFYYDYTNKQDVRRLIDSNGFGIVRIENATSATSYGLEAELQAHLTDSLFIDGSASFLNSEFDEFFTEDEYFPEDDNDRSGNKTPLSPELKLNVGAQYEWEGMDGYFSIRADYTWVDDQYSSVFNRDSRNGAILGTGDLIPSYSLINARLEWESNSEDWSIQLYVKNLADKYIISTSYVVRPDFVYVSQLPPRTWGAKIKYRF